MLQVSLLCSSWEEVIRPARWGSLTSSRHANVLLSLSMFSVWERWLGLVTCSITLAGLLYVRTASSCWITECWLFAGLRLIIRCFCCPFGWWSWNTSSFLFADILTNWTLAKNPLCTNGACTRPELENQNSKNLHVNYNIHLNSRITEGPRKVKSLCPVFPHIVSNAEVSSDPE